MKKLLPFLIFIFLYGCQQKKSDYELEIHLNDGQDISEMYLFEEIGNTVDTVKSDNGVFKFSGVLDEPQICRIYSGKYPQQKKTFILDFGKTSIRGEATNLHESEILFDNPTNNDLRMQFKQLMSDAQQENLIWTELVAARANNNMEEVHKRFMAIDSLTLNFKNKIYQFVESNGSQYGTAEVISEELANEMVVHVKVLKTSEYLKIYNLYTRNIQESFYGKKLKHVIDVRNDAPDKIGNQIIDFEMNNENGNKISIRDFRNKYVLVEFWSSGCGPCRIENSNLVWAYSKYNPKGFEIISISSDKNKEEWKEAIKKDKLTWTNLIDLEGSESELEKHYNIDFTPTNILVDKSGKILATNLRGYELQRKLDEIFKK